MQKKIIRRTNENSNLCVVFTSEEAEIYGLNEDDIVDLELYNIKKSKGGRR